MPQSQDKSGGLRDFCVHHQNHQLSANQKVGGSIPSSAGACTMYYIYIYIYICVCVCVHYECVGVVYGVKAH